MMDLQIKLLKGRESRSVQAILPMVNKKVKGWSVTAQSIKIPKASKGDAK